MHLTPVYMNMYAAKNDLEGCEEYDVLDCIECGSCAYDMSGTNPACTAVPRSKDARTGKAQS